MRSTSILRLPRKRYVVLLSKEESICTFQMSIGTKTGIVSYSPSKDVHKLLCKLFNLFKIIMILWCNIPLGRPWPADRHLIVCILLRLIIQLVQRSA